MTPSWWGGPPGPRGTPPSRCRTRRQGPPRGRGRPLHDFAGDVWLSQVDTHSPLFQNAKALVCERRRRDPRAIPVRPSATGEEDDCRVELVLRRRNPRRFTMAGTLYTAMRTAKIG